ncbi:N-acetylmuramoyl-L-alanine amidase [Streptomyces sp. NPDC048442]|uniref:peptidoglycan recognition protein family protein n=1 Tax=Streptomyces sp. NPDC048442 TaxID=3154823 RepID=UPI00342A6298
MRATLASSIGVTCAALLALPFVLPDGASTDQQQLAGSQSAELPGTTRSLPLTPPGGQARGSDRGSGPGLDRGFDRGLDRAVSQVPQVSLEPQAVEPFSLVGVVWEDPRAVLEGQVQVRTRAVGTGVWSPWQELDAHSADGADPGAAEVRAHGSTAPLWVGASDGVEARVRRAGTASAPLPAGLRLDLVDPGPDPRRPRAAAAGLELPALTRAETKAEAEAEAGSAKPYIGPRPRIVLRKGWGADERLKEKGNVYTKTIKVAFVHHSATGNGYSCSQSGSVLRSIYRYHVKSSGWRDFGYNFAVDKCGNVYEGRAGGVAKPVMGAHTLGFNTNSMGIAVLGTYSHANPPAAAVNAVAKLTAWKLGLHGANPKAATHLTSGGSNLYRKGANVRLNVVSGHRDGFATECPGGRLYGKLGTARWAAGRLQGR